MPVCVVGDALCAGSIGGCPDSQTYRFALANLREHVFTLPDETILLPVMDLRRRLERRGSGIRLGVKLSVDCFAYIRIHSLHSSSACWSTVFTASA